MLNNLIGEVIIDGEKTGILSRHAYSLLDVIELPNPKTKETYQLLRVRNPWGKTEWVGDWSDASDEIETHKDLLQKYVDDLEDDEKFEIGAEDGTFFISYQDWSQIYNTFLVDLIWIINIFTYKQSKLKSCLKHFFRCFY